MTPTEIRAAAWAGNIGIRMPADAIGLDVDAYRGGKVSLDAMVQRLGPLPNTWISHSGRNDGSGIRFFRTAIMPAWVASLPGIDIIQRGHRYAAVWPSEHPDGRHYGWWDQTIGGQAEVVPHIDDLPDLPFEWAQELSRAGVNDHSLAASTRDLNDFIDVHTMADQPGYISVITDHFAEQHRRGISRHDNMQHCLTWAMENVAAGIAPARPTIRTLAEQWVTVIGTDTRRAELFSVRRTTEFEAMLRHAVGKALAKSQEELWRLHDDVAGIPVKGATVVIADYQPSVPSVAVEADKFRFIDWNAPREAADELVEGLLIGGRWTQLVAARKEGKSSLCMFVAIELSEGRHPFDGTAMAEPMAVVYLDGEMGEADMQELIEACGHKPGDLTNLYCSADPLRLDLARDATRILEAVDDVQARLVVLDGLNGFIAPGSDENDVKAWTPFYDGFIRPLKARRVAVLSGDNLGKDATKGARGSSVKGDKADGVLNVRRTDNGVALKLLYGRAALYGDKLDLEAEGHDRRKPIRYRRVAGGWPSGTKEGAAVLDWLGVNPDLGRDKVRALLRWAIEVAEANSDDPEPFRISNDALAGAIRHRKRPIAPQPSGVRTGLRTGANGASGTGAADSLFTPGLTSEDR